MRRSLLVALALLLVACGSKSPSDQARDEKMLARALEAANASGEAFTMQAKFTINGSGQLLPRVGQLQAKGLLKNDDVSMALALGSSVFDLVIVDEQLYVKPQSASRWRAMSADSADNVYAPIRLALIRDSVLLASGESGPSVEHTSAGFAHKYGVKPAGQQIEELEGIQVQGQAEKDFLKSAKAEIDVFLLTSSGKLARVEAHLTGNDSQGTRVQIDASSDFTAQSNIGTFIAPPNSIPAPPSDIFAGAV